MEKNTHQLVTVRVRRELRDAFMAHAKEKEIPGSVLIREFMRDTVKKAEKQRQGV